MSDTEQTPEQYSNSDYHKPEYGVRNAPFDEQPGFYRPAKLWLYGNAKLLRARLAFAHSSIGPPAMSEAAFRQIEKEAEELVLSGKVLVCGVHNEGHRRAAVVPLRWGAPRIIVVSGGFYRHFGQGLDIEPFRAARLWRHHWDKKTDLAVSRRSLDKEPSYGSNNPTVDRLIQWLCDPERESRRSHNDPLALAAP